ncbi:MAG: signal peptidase I [Oscillospiraceae bacterium]|nr:signal peptidase I [Ruminococcus sp.]MDE6708416.1 signal peptidase I [Oscillospiraceae bacterium]
MESLEPIQEEAENSIEKNFAPNEKKKSLFNDIIEIIETMLITLFVVVLLISYLTRPVTVDGSSMVPTLQDQDRLVMLRLLYTPKQGDIVVVYNSNGHVLDSDGNVVNSGYGLNENIIKRVIATEGQKIDIRVDEGLVYVDDVALDEPYVNEAVRSNDGAFSYPMTVPEGYVFVMGDNRNHSTDSRSVFVGLVAKEDILGKAYFRLCNMETDGEKQHPVFDTIGFIG